MAFTSKSRKMYVGGKIPSGTDKLLRKTQVDVIRLDSRALEYAEKVIKDVTNPFTPVGAHETAYFLREYGTEQEICKDFHISLEEYSRIILNGKYPFVLTYLESEIILNGYTLYTREFMNIELGGLTIIEVDEHVNIDVLASWVGNLVTNDLKQYTFESLIIQIETMTKAIQKEQLKRKREENERRAQEELALRQQREERISSQVLRGADSDECSDFEDDDDGDSRSSGVYTLEGTSLISDRTDLLGVYKTKRELFKDLSDHTNYLYLTIKEWQGSYVSGEEVIELD